MSTMDAARYRAVCRYAGEWLGKPIPRAWPIDEIDEVILSTGVYVVCEPLERVQYVGSVRRPDDAAGVRRRIREHLREGHKRILWKTIWFVPLRPETPVNVVRDIEGCIGADLEPLGGDRLPRIA